MPEHIERELAIKAVCDSSAHTCDLKKCSYGCREVQAILAVPAADVMPVVRCGECKHCVEHYDTDGNAPYWVCTEWDSGTDYDGYCHYGEKNGR